jgi:DNA-binding transcriptional LysR family regulator
MLDIRLRTFLTLCETQSYTAAAELLHMTQPAVTQHIHYLENHYGCKLVVYSGKQIHLTEQGRLLQEYSRTLKANSERIEFLIARPLHQERPLVFGATLTIGEYTMPPVLSDMIQESPALDITMHVDNTAALLGMLWAGEIDFALLEGRFDKSAYHYRLLSQQPYVAVCAPDNPIALTPCHLEDLLSQKLITREQGSGTRDILAQVLSSHSLTFADFGHVIEISNTNAIKQLVTNGVGITFLYQEAVREELRDGSLRRIPLDDPEVRREFNFVWLKDGIEDAYCLRWFEEIKRALHRAGTPSI